MLEVRDDGQGFDVNQVCAGQMGLETMRERAQSLGGTLGIESELNRGTRVHAEIPLRIQAPV